MNTKEFDIPQLRLMKQRIAQFNLSVYTHHLKILKSNLYSLLNSLKDTDEDWKNDFIGRWGNLEIEYAFALYREQTTITSESSEIVNESLRKLSCMIDAKLSDYSRDQVAEENLTWIMKWYFQPGVMIDKDDIEICTLDSPACRINLNLTKTKLIHKQFNEVSIDRTKEDWIYCYVETGKFQGTGGPLNLPEILQILRDWIEDKAVEEKL